MTTLHRRLIAVILMSVTLTTACNPRNMGGDGQWQPPIATIRPPRPTKPAPTAVATLTSIAASDALHSNSAEPALGSVESTLCPFEKLNVSAGVAECGYVWVPEDHAQPEDKLIRVFFARFGKANADSTADPVFFLTGGPGGSSLETVESFYTATFLPFTRDHDLVVIDQRGTGHSRPLLDCDELNSDYETTAQWSVPLDRCRRQFADAGVALRNYTTPQSAGDIDLLRQALGYDKMILWGASSGTTLALMTMRAFPDHISGSILDGVVPPQVNYAVNQDWVYDHAFQRLLDACEGDYACDAAYPELRKNLYDLVAAFNRNPVWIPPQNASDDGYYMNGSDFLNLLFMTMYWSDWVSYLPRVINEARYYSYDTLSYLSQSQSNSGGQFADALKLNIDCAEELAFANKSDYAAAEAKYTWLYVNRPSDAMHNWEMLEVCRIWSVTPIDAEWVKPVESDIPTLLVSSDLDPVTPPEYALEAEKTLSRATNIVIHGGGHAVLTAGNRCAIDVGLAFAADPLSKPDTTCVAHEPKISFATD